jgi:hypothetical protein
MLLPTPSGWPVVTLNSTGQTTGLLSLKTAYRFDKSETLYKVGTIAYTYTKTSGGFPLTMNSRHQDFDSAGRLIMEGAYTSGAYLFEDCL